MARTKQGIVKSGLKLDPAKLGLASNFEIGGGGKKILLYSCDVLQSLQHYQTLNIKIVILFFSRLYY